MTATLSGGPGNLTDWVGLYRIGAPDTEPTDWQYLSGTRTPPAAGLRSATLTFTATDADINNTVVGLTGTGTESAIAVAPSPEAGTRARLSTPTLKDSGKDSAS